MSAACANSFLFFMLLVRVGNASIAVDLRRNYTAIRRSNRPPAVLLRAPLAGYWPAMLGANIEIRICAIERRGLCVML